MFITEQINESIDAGILLGRFRFVSAIPEFDPRADDIVECSRFIFDCVRNIEEDWNPRAVQILSELITIGMYSRRHYEEPGLTMDQIQNFAAVLEIIFNSWLHR